MEKSTAGAEWVKAPEEKTIDLEFGITADIIQCQPAGGFDLHTALDQFEDTVRNPAVTRYPQNDVCASA